METPRPPRPGGLQSRCRVRAQEICFPGPTLHGGARPRAGEGFRSEKRLASPHELGKQRGKPRARTGASATAAGARPHLGRNFAGRGRGGGCGRAGVAAALCLQAPVDPRGNRRRRSQRGSERGAGRRGRGGPRGGRGWECEGEGGPGGAEEALPVPATSGSPMPVPGNLFCDLGSCSSFPKCPHHTSLVRHQPPRDLPHLLNCPHPGVLYQCVGSTQASCELQANDGKRLRDKDLFVTAREGTVSLQCHGGLECTRKSQSPAAGPQGPQERGLGPRVGGCPPPTTQAGPAMAQWSSRQAFSSAPAGQAQISCSLLSLPGKQAGHSRKGGRGWGGGGGERRLVHPIPNPCVTGPGLPQTYWLFDLPKRCW